MKNKRGSLIHVYHVEVAAKYGMNEAIVLACLKSLSEGEHAVKRDGRRWVTVSVRALSDDHLPELSAKQIRLALQRLEDEGLIVSEISNLDPYSRTKSYTLTDRANSYLTEGNGVE